MEWVGNLYAETKNAWEKSGKNERGFAIFYSPVKEDAKIAIIGYNPGGGSESFDIKNAKEPEEHEYLSADYPMAKKMKKIFAEAGLDLNDTIKFNLIFFRSRTAIEFNNKELIHFSEQRVLKILNQLKPKLIITEGFATFERLIQLKRGITEGQIEYNGKALMLKGSMERSVRLLGLRHPTGKFVHLSDDELIEAGKIIKKIVKDEGLLN